MLSDYFTTVGQVEIFGVVAFFLFFIFFIVITVHTLTLSNRDIEKMKRMPLDDEPGSQVE